MNILRKNLIISLIAVGLFSLASIGLAQSLTVEFEANPLFSEANFLPGDSVDRYIKITNVGDREKQVVVGAINVNDPDNFAQTFSIEIREGAVLLYSDTLANFFAEDEINLSVLGMGNQTQYDFTIAFETGTGDEYQEKQLGFDIVIGFLGETAVGGEGNTGGGGTGSGILGVFGLEIYNETALPMTLDQALITWQTNYVATSRVIYGIVPGVFDFNSPPNYGYQFSTAEFNTPASSNGLVNHAINLSGLTPGVTYYYRVVSTASPPTISFERSFMIEPENLSGRGIDYSFPVGMVLGEHDEEVAPLELTDVQAHPTSNGMGELDEFFTAQAGRAFSFSWPWWILILVLIIITYLLFRRKEKKE